MSQNTSHHAKCLAVPLYYEYYLLYYSVMFSWVYITKHFLYPIESGVMSNNFNPTPFLKLVKFKKLSDEQKEDLRKEITLSVKKAMDSFPPKKAPSTNRILVYFLDTN